MMDDDRVKSLAEKVVLKLDLKVGTELAFH